MILVFSLSGAVESSPRGGRDAGTAAVDPAEGIGEAVALAKAEAKRAGYGIGDFQINSLERGPIDERWTLRFVRRPPTPPGGHFKVYVDLSDGTARLVPGR